MYAARVIGTVVCTTKDEKLSGRKNRRWCSLLTSLLLKR